MQPNAARRSRRRHPIWRSLAWSFCALLLLVQSVVPYDTPEQLLTRVVTGSTFDFWGWELAALREKFAQATAGTQDWLRDDERRDLVRGYFARMAQIEQRENWLTDYAARRALLSADEAEAAEREAVTEREELAALRAAQQAERPLVEAILEEQISSVLADMGFGAQGGILPPVSVHFTPLPYMLIVSPRDKIEQRYQVGLDNGLLLERQEALESAADTALDMRSLVVPIGGLALYPAMLLETSSFEFVVEASSHEWVHHWLLLRPLGYEYDRTPEARTINETVASIAGREIRAAVLARFYPAAGTLAGRPAGPAALDDVFDYGREMHITRTRVDELLAAGQVDAAEQYMEERRLVFVEHGYAIRKLNQAFFAFYGGYQATPGGAAGDDPIGPALQDLRARATSLKVFMDQVAGVTSLEELRGLLGQ